MSIYFTVTGTVHQLGQSFIKPGDKVILEKEPDNQFDKEAIVVKMDVLGKIGYVANNYNTIIGDCFSAGQSMINSMIRQLQLWGIISV